MKARSLTVRKMSETPGTIPCLPANAYSGEWFLLLHRDPKSKRVLDRQLFRVNAVESRICVPGFTHYVRLPSWLS